MKKRTKASRGHVLLAIDQGTTGTKALLVDRKLKIVAEHSMEFPQHFPRPGWVEHDVEEIFRSVRSTVRRVLSSASVAPKNIAAIGITNQRETTVVWDKKTGKTIYPAIVWQDRRTAPICDKLKTMGAEPLIRRKTGLVVDPYFSGTKIAWILDKVSGARARAKAGHLLFGTIDSYLVWRLTGGKLHVTDISNASRTLLMDLKSCRWNRELCQTVKVPEAMLPEIQPNDGDFGVTSGLGFLPDGIPIASVIGDQQSALFGQACFAQGEAKCTYGTGGFVMVNTGQKIVRSRHGVLSTAAWRLRNRPVYALEGSAFVAGAIVQWLRDGLKIIRSASKIEALAATVEDAGGVVFVPALTGLGAPYWDPEAQGLISGITRGTTDGHVARAALEGIAFQIHDLVTAMESDIGRRLRNLKVDGGASLNNLLMQFQADILRLRVVRPTTISTTALGAALMAGLSVGLYPSLSAIRDAWTEDRTFRAAMHRTRVKAHLARWGKALDRTQL